MRIDLDYNIVSAEDRCAKVRDLTPQLANATPATLEKVANYILYGKSANGNKLAEAKEITPKHSTWRRKEPESLDSLMENVLFDEQTLSPIGKRSIYVNPKPTISRDHDGAIPGMAQLWEAIDLTEKQLHTEELNGKTLKVYYLRHLLIDLRKEQYTLKALFQPTIASAPSFTNTTPHEIDWFSDSGYPIDHGNGEWEWHTVAEHTVDFTNPTHIYHILDNYSALRHQVYDTPNTSTSYLLYAVECLVKKTKLSPSRYHILVRKVDRAPNERIVQELSDKFGVNYATNYISTIWTKEICGAIARTAEIDRDEWLARNLPHKWKTCIRCHTKKLRDLRFFSLKSTTHDGLNPICKECQSTKKKDVIPNGRKAKTPV